MINSILISREKRVILHRDTRYLGVSGENLQELLIFNLDEDLEGQGIVELEFTDGKTGFIEIERTERGYELPVKSSLLIQSGTLKMQLRILQNKQEVFKSEIMEFLVKKSINATETIPEQYPSWIDNLTTLKQNLEKSEEERVEAENKRIEAELQREETFSQMEEEQTTQNNRLDSLEKDNSTNKTDISNLQQDNTTNKSNIKSLQDDNESNKTNIQKNTESIEEINNSDFATKKYVEQEIANFDFIKIVTELPETGLVNRTYFVPKTDTESNDLYDEYMWIDNKWELLGTKQIEVDLTDYVKKTDIATNTELGLVRTGNWITVNQYGELQLKTGTYKEYLSEANNKAVGKGTLENVIAGKELVNKTYVDNLVGDINTLLTDLDTGSGV